MSSWPVMIVLGIASALLTGVGARRALLDCELPPRSTPWVFAVVGLVLSIAFVYVSDVLRWQSTEDVIPTEFWRQARIPYHLTLIVLLLMATATDLRGFYIVNWNSWLGVFIAVLGAVIAGDFQLCHIWVDWNQAVPQLSGPYRPAWLSAHPHLHGLAWSLAGAVCGAAATAGIRGVSSTVLGLTTLGSGDVLLMAMIGAYLGWQPTVIVTLLAPLLALSVGGLIKAATNRPALPYGPFLALAALIVLFCWRWIWELEIPLGAAGPGESPFLFSVRRLFGDWVALVTVLGGSVALFVVLLGLLRVYKSLPVRKGPPA